MATAASQEKNLRTPIVCVMGHVDHGKTSLLDKIRGTAVVNKEAGAITQHIGATEVPLSTVQTLCKGMLGTNMMVPGLLFIDTPGHHAFTTLRSRGGALADLAVVVIDINEGFQPQTIEAIKILRQFKTPFVVAANKIDRIHGWTPHPNEPFVKTFNAQPDYVQTALDTKTYEIVGRLDEIGFSSDRYDRVRDFQRNVGIVPLSAKTGEGVPDLLMVLIGLAQRFLEESLKFHVTGPGVGTILEVKEERGLGFTIDTILYDGVIKVGDTVVIGGREQPFVTKVRALLKPKPNREIRVEERFDRVHKVTAAAGIKILAPDLDKAMAGAPLRVATEANAGEIKDEIARELEEAKIITDETGVMVKADTLGSLEAIVKELREVNIPVGHAGVGDISKRDLVNAQTVNDPLYRVILGFNVATLPEAKDFLQTTDIKAFNSEVIYHLIDEFRKVGDRPESAGREEALRRDRAPRQDPLPAQLHLPAEQAGGHRRPGHGRLHQARRDAGQGGQHQGRRGQADPGAQREHQHRHRRERGRHLRRRADSRPPDQRGRDLLRGRARRPQQGARVPAQRYDKTG